MPEHLFVEIGSGSLAWAVAALREQGMPSEEIAAVIGADDQVLVRRYLELHQERLEERVADQLTTLSRLGSLLVARPLPERKARSGGARPDRAAGRREDVRDGRAGSPFLRTPLKER